MEMAIFFHITLMQCCIFNAESEKVSWLLQNRWIGSRRCLCMSGVVLILLHTSLLLSVCVVHTNLFSEGNTSPQLDIDAAFVSITFASACFALVSATLAWQIARYPTDNFYMKTQILYDTHAHTHTYTYTYTHTVYTYMHTYTHSKPRFYTARTLSLHTI